MRLLDSLDELAPLDMGDHILILPEDMPMKEAINTYCMLSINRILREVPPLEQLLCPRRYG